MPQSTFGMLPSNLTLSFTHRQKSKTTQNLSALVRDMRTNLMPQKYRKSNIHSPWQFSQKAKRTRTIVQHLQILEGAHFMFTLSLLDNPKFLKMLTQLSDEQSRIFMVGIWWREKFAMKTARLAVDKVIGNSLICTNV